MEPSPCNPAPLLVKSFSKRPRTQSEASRKFGGSHIHKTKQTTFLHKETAYVSNHESNPHLKTLFIKTSVKIRIKVSSKPIRIGLH
jgi:hypothetical protein